VSGDTKVDGTLLSTGNVDFDSDLNVDGNSSLVGTLEVTGATTLSNDLYVSGNQGIGTTSPTVSGLDIDVTSANGNIIRVKNSGTGSFISFEDQGSTANYNWIGATSNNLIFRANNEERVRVTYNGKVGINETNPQQTLHVGGQIRIEDTDARLEIHDTTGDNYRIQNQNGTLKFINSTDSDREDIAITGGGRVGIDKSVPEGKLHVYSSASESNDVSAVFEGDDHSIVRIKGTGQRTINFVNSSSDTNWMIGMDDSNGSGGNASDYIIKQGDNVVPEFIVDTSGNIGINTNNPERKLDVNATNLNNAFRVRDSSSYIMTNTIGGSPVLEMQDDTGSAFIKFIKGSDTENDVFLRAYDGKIGISNNQADSPDELLHVRGNIKADGFTVAGTLTIGTLNVTEAYTTNDITVNNALSVNNLTKLSGQTDIGVYSDLQFQPNKDIKDVRKVTADQFQVNSSNDVPNYCAPFTTIIVEYSSGN